MSKITVDEKGRIIIPKEERKALGLEPGMTLKLERRGKELIIRKIIPLKKFMKELRGCIKEKEKDDQKEIKPLELKNLWENKKRNSFSEDFQQII